MINLTQMHKATDGRISQRPTKWLAQKDTIKFLKALEKKLNVPQKDIDLVKTTRGGKHPGTWGHWQIALAYAKYLSPEFHIQCNEWIRERFQFEADPGAAIDHYYDKLEQKYQAMGWSPERIETRIKGR